MMVEYSTIQLRKETKKLLEESREPGESFDAAIRRKLKEAEAGKAKEFLREVNRQLADRKAMKPLR